MEEGGNKGGAWYVSTGAFRYFCEGGEIIHECSRMNANAWEMVIGKW